MTNYQYSYFIGVIPLIIVWAILFIIRKDTRKIMLLMSTIFGSIGVIAEFIYIIDWWHPLTITNTLIGIEDFIFAFTTSGIASVIYLVFFKKKLSEKIQSNNIKSIRHFSTIILVLFGWLFISFFIFGLNSFYSTMIAATVPILYIWYKRKDLIIVSLYSGLLLALISFLAFLLPEMVTPGWIANTWFLENLSGIIILKAPLEDLIWFFFAGLLIGPLYEFSEEIKIIDFKVIPDSP